ncbi:MAG TPA: helix-turn-helix domain-containing protein [Terriglobia bacterium]|nr:helix-turn-helix domain-containing protein [Terriglobia bacterium]
MTIEIEGVRYFSAADVQQQLSVTRQTLWRWRREGKVPLGQRYRDRQVLYTEDDLKVIREYANRLVPADSAAPIRMARDRRRLKGKQR